MMGITGAFSSLGINERARSKDNKKFPNNCSTISLPNMVLSERPTISSKFIRPVCDDDPDGEQPVDFSKKYFESKPKDKKSPRNCTFNNVAKSYNTSFTMYAETDLDQPTDYSLRYAEDDSDSDRCNKIPKTETTEFVQDTVKTYCTEDTPYETPFNFSTSTSMSDLRIDDKTDKLEHSDSKSGNVTVINTKEVESVQSGKLKSEFCSGLMSPEKPVNYCEEGTPGYFSRVPSCGSLNSIPKQEQKEENSHIVEDAKKELRRAETKAVKFEEVVNYAEETPLMFSRSSSLASLDSIDQHSIHDDRSSVVSDFSRLTSGVISPSELPDSPSQTVPPSPRPRKTVIMFPPPPKKETEETPKTVQNVPKCSVFEDVVKKFKVESTPLQFSAATSLSSLIDDDEKDVSKESETVAPPEDKDLDNLDLNNDLSESSEDEDILAACINIGMQSNRYSQTKTKSPPPSNAPPPYKFSPHSEISSSRITLKSTPQILSVAPENDHKTDVTSDSLRTYCTEGTPALLSHAGSNSDLSTLSMNLNEKVKDTLEAEKRELCDLNRVREEESVPEPKTDSRRSSFSGVSDDSDDDALLEECILAGMPKTKNPDNAKPADKKNQNETVTEEEADILEKCIVGIDANSSIKNDGSGCFYTQPKLKSEYQKPASNSDDTVKRYYTEDTPAILSHAGSISNLSILSTQENYATSYFSDVNSNFSDDDDDDKLLEECVKYGMAAISGKIKPDENRQPPKKTETVPRTRGVPSDDSVSSFSDDSFETDKILLQQCIQAGMPKRKQPEKALLQQCILEGMKKCRIVPAKPDDASELTQAEQALLRQCILAGMPKNKNLSQGGPSRSRESTELTVSERLLLQQCILAGMPKNRNKLAGSRWIKKSKQERSSEHTCCVHCPRNNKTKGSGHAKGKKKYKERGAVQYRESRDVNIVYVTNQILVKKEVLDRTHDNWV